MSTLRCLPLLFILVFVSGEKSNAAISNEQPTSGIDFAAIVQGKGCVIHVDDRLKATVNTIDFLKDEQVVQWDMASLGQVITTQEAMSQDQSFEIKYYDKKAYVRSFKIRDAEFITWMFLLPQKNCLILETRNAQNLKRLIRVDIASGVEKEVVLGTAGEIRCKPLWDAKNGNFIVIITSGTPLIQQNNQAVVFARMDPEGVPYIMARLDPDSLEIKDSKVIDGVKIDGLLSLDSSSNSITAYGVIGTKLDYRNGHAGIINIVVDSGKATMIMREKESERFIYDESGLAIIDSRYVVMMKWLNTGGVPPGSCADLKNQTWAVLGTPFQYPISHEGSHLPDK